MRHLAEDAERKVVGVCVFFSFLLHTVFSRLTVYNNNNNDKKNLLRRSSTTCVWKITLKYLSFSAFTSVTWVNKELMSTQTILRRMFSSYCWVLGRERDYAWKYQDYGLLNLPSFLISVVLLVNLLILFAFLRLYRPIFFPISASTISKVWWRHNTIHAFHE